MNPISELGPKDEEALTRFFLDNDRPEITDLFRAFPMDATSAARICHRPRRDRYFAMYEGEEIVCFGMLRGWDEGYEVPTFGLTADHRSNGRGHGWRMWRWAIGLARDLGAKKLRITTDLKNAIILGMAAKLGFKKTRELPNERVEMIADI